MPNLPSATSSDWNILRILQWAGGFLKQRGIESPRSAAEILLAHALGTDRVRLYMHHDQPLEKHELALFKTLLQRRLQREPVAYIVGRKGFWSLDLDVTPAVLIPRPETERLVEAALAWLAGRPADRPARVLDLGTGSGAIVLALACEAGRHRFAALRGREHVLPDDIKYLACPVLAHRLILEEQEQLRGSKPEQKITEILEQVAVPLE